MYSLKLILKFLPCFLFFLFRPGFGVVYGQQKDTEQLPYLVVLSMDGFRWDYPEKADTPNLDKLAAKGVKAERLIPSFPTKTFPNHYTMATGLYPDHHGIVLNSFYDPDKDRYYSISNRKSVGDSSFYSGEPIWVTAEKQGVKAATLFWVGSEAAIKGVRPSIWKKYNGDMPFENRIDTVIAWLQLPEVRRPHLIMWYFEEPDGVGHDFGPDHPKTFQTIGYLDSLVGVFIDKLKRLPIAEKVNIIITSDHGMGGISTERSILLKDYIHDGWIDKIEGDNPIFTLEAKAGFKDQLDSALATIPHVKAWRTGSLPARLNYGTNPRTLDFVVVADSAWSLGNHRIRSYNGGAHGYDHENDDMHAIFYASGPAFKKGFTAPSFQNVDLYPLMCNILGLSPVKTDGNFERVKAMLKTGKP